MGKMTDQHPITPPPELVEQWAEAWYGAKVKHDELVGFVATQAARWGADTELEACISHVDTHVSGNRARAMREARRPQPPSLKEQALLAIDTAVADDRLSAVVADVVRRALEALPDD
jgi:hypothetical protein